MKSFVTQVFLQFNANYSLVLKINYVKRTEICKVRRNQINCFFQRVDPEDIFFHYTCICEDPLSPSCYCPLFIDFLANCVNAGAYDPSLVPSFCKGVTAAPYRYSGSVPTVSASPVTAGPTKTTEEAVTNNPTKGSVTEYQEVFELYLTTSIQMSIM